MPKSGSKPLVLALASAALLSAAVLAVVGLRRGLDSTGEAGALARSAAPGDPATPSARDGATTEAILASADELVRRAEADRAEAVLRAAVAQHPEDQELRLALAGACVLQDKLPAAYEQYEAALALGPRTPEIEFTAGTVASTLDRLDRAEEHFSAAQAGDTSDPRFPLYLAQIQMKQGANDAARKNLLLATRLDETLAIAWGTLAEISLRESEPNVALQLVARARELEPAVAAWRVIEARALNRVRQPDRALAALGGIPEAERRQLPILRLVGECYGLLGRPAEAMSEFEAAAAQSPEDGDLLFDTAVWCERANEPDKARAYARRAADLGIRAGADMAARLTALPEDPG
ncbi:MAG TPA: tetratricopeptide repeat protein [Phycisphaerales bacterium]|nr:tetratricopeptide repeat protein [Phycisphaerales bacterium]